VTHAPGARSRRARSTGGNRVRRLRATYATERSDRAQAPTAAKCTSHRSRHENKVLVTALLASADETAAAAAAGGSGCSRRQRLQRMAAAGGGRGGQLCSATELEQPECREGHRLVLLGVHRRREHEREGRDEYAAPREHERRALPLGTPQLLVVILIPGAALA